MRPTGASSPSRPAAATWPTRRAAAAGRPVDDAALRAQISENMARRDLSFIEKALFAQELIASGFGNQSQVAEVLTVTKSAISMALSVVCAVGVDLIRAIGAAHGIGRPRWEALGSAIAESGADRAQLVELAEEVHNRVSEEVLIAPEGEAADVSVRAFEAVERAALKAPAPAKTSARTPRATTRPLLVDGKARGSVKRTASGVTLSLTDGGFADWIESEAQDLIDELHARWQRRTED